MGQEKVIGEVQKKGMVLTKDEKVQKALANQHPPLPRETYQVPVPVTYNQLTDERLLTRPDKIDGYLRMLEESVKTREAIWPEFSALVAFSAALLTTEKFRDIMFSANQWAIIFVALWLVSAFGLGRKVYARVTKKLVTREQIMNEIRKDSTIN